MISRPLLVGLAFIVFNSNAAISAPYDAMKLVFEDEFSGKELDTDIWFAGPKPEGDSGQWGGAYFVKKGDPQFSKVYNIVDGSLRISAFFDESFNDPNGWGRKWFSGEISSAFPSGKLSAGTRVGYFTARMKMPANKGAWPGFWLLNLPSIFKKNGDKGAVEIDVVEAYGHDRNAYMATLHNWRPGLSEQSVEHNTRKELAGRDISSEYHDYGVKVTDSEVIWYFDEKEVFKAPLYRAEDAQLGNFFTLLDLAISQDWPVVVPPNKRIDLYIDSVRIYSPN